MERLLLKELESWRTSSGRKPLILHGARQVGKTWLLKEFGKRCFENMAYVRLEDNAAMMQLFEGSLDPNRHLATGNINLFGGATDGSSFIRTNNGSTENDLAGGIG